MAQRRFRVGVQVRPEHTTVPSMREAWRRIEDLGVETLWTWDHFFPLRADPQGPQIARRIDPPAPGVAAPQGEPQGAHFECWTLLAAMAVTTTRVEFGAMVSAIGYRNPALLSNMAKTVDHLSGGRLILGLGAGWSARDFREFGYPMPPGPERLRELRRGIGIIKERWAVDEPPPVRNPIPILIGGGGEKVTMRIAAQHAQIWNWIARPPVYAAKSLLLDEHCRAVGRDPGEIERSVNIEVADAHDPATLDAYAEAGATHLILRFPEPWDFAAVENLVAWRDRANGR